MLGQAAEKDPKVLLVLSNRVTRYQYVVHVNKHKLEIPEHGIHQSLAGLPGIFQAERHPQKLKITKRRGQGSLRDVSWRNRNLVISRDEIHLSEKTFAGQSGGKVSDERDGVSIGRSGGVQAQVIATWPKRAVIFWHDVQWGRPWASGSLDDPKV